MLLQSALRTIFLGTSRKCIELNILCKRCLLHTDTIMAWNISPLLDFDELSRQVFSVGIDAISNALLL